MTLPPFRLIRQDLFSSLLPDVEASVAGALSEVFPALAPGTTVAVTAGSRGITGIPLILGAVCRSIRAAGGDPFLVPAMGSHGGATATGQVALLESLGITEESVGAPIRAGMEVVTLGRTPSGVEVYLDQIASRAGGIVVVERIKPHTDYSGPWESGLAKMMAVGLGKEAGATRIHSLGARGLRETIPDAARVILREAPILAGLAILEDAHGHTSRVVGLRPAEMLDREAGLLTEAKAHAPRLPFPEADLLIVDYIGKEVSGTGMDTKVIGRMRIAGEPEPDRPRIRCLAALDLTDASHGNANGVGLADVITARLAAKTDPEALRVNAVACGFWERAKTPVALANDRQAIAAALQSCGRPAAQARICRIRDTLKLGTLAVSEPLVEALDGRVEIVQPYRLDFDAQGDLRDHAVFPDVATPPLR